jgi:hypothetical protein
MEEKNCTLRNCINMLDDSISHIENALYRLLNQLFKLF